MLNIKPLPPKYPETFCTCAETLMPDGTRVPQPQFHDCLNGRFRDSLIPAASRFANARVPDDSSPRWTPIFVAEMNRLAARPMLVVVG